MDVSRQKVNHKKMPQQLLLACVSLFLISAPAFSQTSQASQTAPPSAPNSPSQTAESEKDTRMFASMEDEMRAKRDIQAADKAYRDNLNRARALASLGSALSETYKAKSQLSKEDLKTLEKAEKLAKGLRDALGGCDDEVEIDNPPTNLADGLDRISTLAAALRDKVEKTPKRVVSAEVIDEANVLLQLIKLVRSMTPRT
jgi:hypothetical protein